MNTYVTLGSLTDDDESCVVAQVAGYVLTAMVDHDMCEECVNQLQGVKSTDPLMALIYISGSFSKL